MSIDLFMVVSKDIKNLRSRIEKLNLHEINVAGDGLCYIISFYLGIKNLFLIYAIGNCQFRAIAGSLFNNPELHLSVRRAIVRWLLLNENYSPSNDDSKLSDFIDREIYPTWKDFCEYMSNDQGNIHFIEYCLKF